MTSAVAMSTARRPESVSAGSIASFAGVAICREMLMMFQLRS
jgi:hypothetical protein